MMMLGGFIVLLAALLFSLVSYTVATGSPPNKPPTPLLPTHWAKVDSTNFNSFTSKGTSVVVFWQEWCIPCLELRETVLADSTFPVRIGSYDIAFNDPYREKIGIETLPTLVLYSDGKVVSWWQADLKFQFDHGIVLEDLEKTIVGFQEKD
jgi:thiol-disulfide isomerase/thioredoxin